MKNKFFKKAGLVLYKTFCRSNSKQMTADERSCVMIALKLIKSNGCAIYLSPIDSIAMIEVKNKNKLLILDFNMQEVSIINGSYMYYVKIQQRCCNFLTKLIMGETQKRRENIRNEYYQRVTHSLRDICRSLK